MRIGLSKERNPAFTLHTDVEECKKKIPKNYFIKSDSLNGLVQELGVSTNIFCIVEHLKQNCPKKKNTKTTETVPVTEHCENVPCEPDHCEHECCEPEHCGIADVVEVDHKAEQETSEKSLAYPELISVFDCENANIA